MKQFYYTEQNPPIGKETIGQAKYIQLEMEN